MKHRKNDSPIPSRYLHFPFRVCWWECGRPPPDGRHPSPSGADWASVTTFYRYFKSHCLWADKNEGSKINKSSPPESWGNPMIKPAQNTSQCPTETNSNSIRKHTISPPIAACSASRAPLVRIPWKQSLRKLKHHPKRYLLISYSLPWPQMTSMSCQRFSFERKRDQHHQPITTSLFQMPQICVQNHKKQTFDRHRKTGVAKPDRAGVRSPAFLMTWNWRVGFGSHGCVAEFHVFISPAHGFAHGCGDRGARPSWKPHNVCVFYVVLGTVS